MYVLNVITPTKDGDLYDEVALNSKPIIWSEELDELYQSEEFKIAIKDIIKKKSVYDRATISWRCLNDDFELVSEGEDKVSEKIKLDL